MNLLLSIISIFAVLATSIISAKVGLRSTIQVKKKEAKLLIYVAVFFAGLSVWLQIDNYNASKLLTSRINELNSSNQYLNRYVNGSSTPPQIKLEIFQADSNKYIILHLLNRSKFPIKKVKIIIPESENGTLENITNLKEFVIGDIMPRATENFMKKLDDRGFLNIKYILTWGSGHTLKHEYIGYCNIDKKIDWESNYSEDKNVILPDSIIDLKLLSVQNHKKECAFLNLVFIKEIRNQDALIKSLNLLPIDTLESYLLEKSNKLRSSSQIKKLKQKGH